MEIVCPSCLSRFNLPEAAARPGAKLRCSVCKTVFPLPESDKEVSAPPQKSSAAAPDRPAEVPLSMAATPVRGKKTAFIVLSVLLLAAAAGGGAWWWFSRAALPKASPTSTIPLAQKVEKLSMRNVRQYYVNNEKTGAVSVIEGRVVNGFSTPKELIEVEASLYGQDKNPLVTKKQYAGTSLSLFQLQVLGEKELDSFINNKLEVLANNTNIPPGGEVPFMVLFFNPPPSVTEFGVKIVDVRDPEVKK